MLDCKCGVLELMDEKGIPLLPVCWGVSSNRYLYVLTKVPQRVKARLYLASEESVRKIPFKVENILLP